MPTAWDARYRQTHAHTFTFENDVFDRLEEGVRFGEVADRAVEPSPGTTETV